MLLRLSWTTASKVKYDSFPLLIDRNFDDHSIHPCGANVGPNMDITLTLWLNSALEQLCPNVILFGQLFGYAHILSGEVIFPFPISRSCWPPSTVFRYQQVLYSTFQHFQRDHQLGHGCSLRPSDSVPQLSSADLDSRSRILMQYRISLSTPSTVCHCSKHVLIFRVISKCS